MFLNFTSYKVSRVKCRSNRLLISFYILKFNIKSKLNLLPPLPVKQPYLFYNGVDVSYFHIYKSNRICFTIYKL